MFSHIFPTEEEVNSLRDTLEVIKTHFSPTEANSDIIDFRKFELFSHYRDVNPHALYFLSDAESKPVICFVEVEYYVYLSKYNPSIYREYQTWAAVKLSRDYGNLQIRYETIKDKINEVFVNSEIDFEEDKEFSKKFYVVAHDKTKAKQLLTDAIRAEIKALSIQHFQIEVRGAILIIGNHKVVSPEESLALAQFVQNIANLNT